MASPQTKAFQDRQRIHVSKETSGTEKIIKVSLERFDATLGWYTAAALTIPLHQLPMLQQMLGEIGSVDCAECLEKAYGGKVIAFPTLREFSPAAAETQPD